jgi:hypothetical protein
MEPKELGPLIEAATDRFRLETLPRYTVPEEAEEFSAWRRGERRLATVDESDWLRHLRATTLGGARWWRVRVLDYPLTEYSEYELAGYQGNAAAGEQIYVADRDWSSELADLREDFWLLDDEVVVRMIYDEDGRFVRPERASDSARYRAMRSVAVRHAAPLARFLAEHEPRLIA